MQPLVRVRPLFGLGVDLCFELSVPALPDFGFGHEPFLQPLVRGHPCPSFVGDLAFQRHKSKFEIEISDNNKPEGKNNQTTTYEQQSCCYEFPLNRGDLRFKFCIQSAICIRPHFGLGVDLCFELSVLALPALSFVSESFFQPVVCDSPRFDLGADFSPEFVVLLLPILDWTKLFDQPVQLFSPSFVIESEERIIVGLRLIRQRTMLAPAAFPVKILEDPRAYINIVI